MKKRVEMTVRSDTVEIPKVLYDHIDEASSAAFKAAQEHPGNLVEVVFSIRENSLVHGEATLYVCYFPKPVVGKWFECPTH